LALGRGEGLAPDSGDNRSTKRVASLVNEAVLTHTLRLWGPLVRQVIEHVSATPNDGLVLDAGCGTARGLDSEGTFVGHIVGVDINFESLLKARRNCPQLNLVVADLERLPFADATFAGAFSVSVLQYVDRERALSETARVLKPGAPVAFAENLHGSPVARCYRLAHRVLHLRYGPYLVPRAHLKWEECENIFDRHFRVLSVTARHLMTTLSYLPVVVRACLGLPSSRRLGTMPTLNAIDSFILSRAPSVARFCWTVSVLAAKEKPDLSPEEVTPQLGRRGQ